MGATPEDEADQEAIDEEEKENEEEAEEAPEEEDEFIADLTIPNSKDPEEEEYQE